MKPYANYKDTGIDWLGTVPEHWEIKPLWTAYTRRKTLGSGEEELLSVYRDFGVIPKASRDDNFNRASDDLSKYQIVEPGDLVINKMKAWQGSVAVSEHHGIVSPAYFVFKPMGMEYSRFMHYLMRSVAYFQHYASISKGVRPNQWDLDPDEHRMVPVLCPPLEEQQAIADFLDWETEAVDAFIADQEQLIQLLNERRSATIAQAVAKGLDVASPRNGSGPEWRDAAPEHWDIEKLGWLFKIGNGSTPSSDNAGYWSDGSIPWLNSSCVNLDRVVDPSKLVTPLAVAECHLPKVKSGSLLVALTGQGKTRGMVTELTFDSTINQHMAYLTPTSEKVDLHFAKWSLTSAYDELRFISEDNGGTKGALTCGHLKQFKIALPPLPEQRIIAQYLRSETSEIDAAIADARGAIELSKERRLSLISATVTGKVDVRNRAESAVPA